MVNIKTVNFVLTLDFLASMLLNFRNFNIIEFLKIIYHTLLTIPRDLIGLITLMKIKKKLRVMMKETYQLQIFTQLGYFTVYFAMF